MPETTPIDELRKILVALDESVWHRYATGEKVKRICVTDDAIKRIRAAIGVPTDA